MENQNEKKVPIVTQKVIEILKEHSVTFEEAEHIMRNVREKTKQVIFTSDSLK